MGTSPPFNQQLVHAPRRDPVKLLHEHFPEFTYDPADGPHMVYGEFSDFLHTNSHDTMLWQRAREFAASPAVETDAELRNLIDLELASTLNTQTA